MDHSNLDFFLIFGKINIWSLSNSVAQMKFSSTRVLLLVRVFYILKVCEQKPQVQYMSTNLECPDGLFKIFG